MENQENIKCSKKEKCLKFFLIFVGTIIGAFLAFYFAVDMTFKIMLSPEYHMRRADKMIEQMDKQFARDMRRMDKDIMVIGKEMPNPVTISEEDGGPLFSVPERSDQNQLFAEGVKKAIEAKRSK